MRRSIGVMLAVLLIGLLTACGDDRPPQAIVEQAIALQVEQTQQQLSSQLFRSGADLSVAKVDRVKVKKQQSRSIESQAGYRVEGTYNLTLDSPQQQMTRRQNPFEVYLQLESEDHWNLARPLADGSWEVRSLPVLAPEAGLTPDA